MLVTPCNRRRLETVVFSRFIEWTQIVCRPWPSGAVFAVVIRIAAHIESLKTMPVSNGKVADLLRQYASALLLEGVDRFKVKAYRRAAETVETIPQEVAKLVARGESL